MAEEKIFDVIIVGGSYAGLSAAMALGRAIRKVLVIDSGFPCNRHTFYSHNFLTRDGEVPAEIAVKAKKQVLAYPTVSFLPDLVTGGNKNDQGFSITTRSGKTFTAAKLIFATGIKDLLPAIEGFTECWGKSVLHCPYCHGYEVRGQRTGIIANGDIAFHYAKLVRNWTKDLTIFTNGKSELTAEQLAKVQQHNILVIEKEIASLLHDKGLVRQIKFKDGSSFALQAIYSRPPFEQHCKIPEIMGCSLSEQGYIKVDPFQQTTVPGILACGDNVSQMRSVANAVSSGNFAGAVANNLLTEEAF